MKNEVISKMTSGDTMQICDIVKVAHHSEIKLHLNCESDVNQKLVFGLMKILRKFQKVILEDKV